MSWWIGDDRWDARWWLRLRMAQNWWNRQGFCRPFFTKKKSSRDNTGKPIRVKTLWVKALCGQCQTAWCDLWNRTLVIGKTFVVTLAVTALTWASHGLSYCPAVEAGESLGFLPGDLMRRWSLSSDLFTMLCTRFSKTKTTRLMKREIIEIAPCLHAWADSGWCLRHSMSTRIRPSCRWRCFDSFRI